MTSDITEYSTSGETFHCSCCLFVHVTLSHFKCTDSDVSNSYGGWKQPLSGGVHTVVLVEGDALGGGLESVLPYHRVIFERSAQAGYPEVLFNLFPGMGAWNFTIRKAGFAVASEMIFSGRVYSADELYYRKLVDMVVEDGEGEAAVQQVIRSVHPRLGGVLAALEARRIAAPISYESLNEIVTQWASAAMTLNDRDIRFMERLARAQVRKIGGAGEGAIEEIKRLELDTAWGRDHVTLWTS